MKLKRGEWIYNVRKVLKQYIAEQEKIYNEAKQAADWHNNNTPGVGQTVDYMSYPELPSNVDSAKYLLDCEPID